MHERNWYCGYRCDIVRASDGVCWFGVVSVPRWHPVRIVGIECRTVFLINGMWRIYTRIVDTQDKAHRSVYELAEHLRAMQLEWDALSPFEREYVVW